MLDVEAGFDSVSDLPAELFIDEKQETSEISLRAVEPVAISVQSLSLDIDVSPSGFPALPSLFRKKNKPAKSFKTILHDVTAWIPGGSLTAIIGSSGSGKTSMLNALADRIDGTRPKAAGSISYNENPRLQSIRSAYVMQHDVHITTLTVRETLLCAAELRLPPPTPSAERRQLVEEIILELGLKECADTRIGSSLHKGCSGGEKRRVSLGV